MARTVHPSKLNNTSRSFSRKPPAAVVTDQPTSTRSNNSSRAPRASTSRPTDDPDSTQTSRPSRAKRASAASAEQEEAEGSGRKRAKRKSDESETKRGKRKAAERIGGEEEGGEDDEDDEYVGGGGGKRARTRSAPPLKPARLVQPFSRTVSRKTVARSWRPLSYQATLSIRDTLQQSALDVLGRLQLRDRAVVQGLLSRVEAEIERGLEGVVVPSSGFLSRPAGAAEGVRQVDLPEEAEIRQKIVSWDQARVQENEAIRKLKKVIKNERNLLEDDEARLASFEDARLRVEKKEQKDLAKELHPLVADLLASATADSAASLAHPLGRAEPSKRWVAEAAKVKDTKPHKGPDGDNSEDEDEEEYDAAKDTFLIRLQTRLAGPLTKVEQALEGLGRVRRVVDGAERAVVGLI